MKEIPMDKEIQNLNRRIDELYGITAALTAIIAVLPNINGHTIKDAKGLIPSLAPSPSTIGSSPIESANQRLEKIASMLESFAAIRSAGTR
jgi:hypothetical protein